MTESLTLNKFAFHKMAIIASIPGFLKTEEFRPQNSKINAMVVNGIDFNKESKNKNPASCGVFLLKGILY